MKLLPNTSDFSVKFNRAIDMGLEPQQAFPYIYSMVNSAADTWLPNTSDPNGWTAAQAAANLSDVGPLIAAGQSLEWNIRLDPDCNFKLLHIKYCAYSFTSRLMSPNYIYTCYDEATGGATDQAMVEENSEFIWRPLTDYLRISLSFAGAGSKYIYGGHNLDDIVNNQGSLYPIGLRVLQGNKYGYAQVRTPFLLPREGVLVLKITNMSGTWTRTQWPMTVGAAIYGMKVRV